MIRHVVNNMGGEKKQICQFVCFGFYLQKKGYLRYLADVLSKAIYSHSYTDSGGCHARWRPAHQEQFGVQYLTQGQIDKHTRGIKPATFT